MENKKNSDRFTIKFKAKEPKHKMAMEILNRQGRNKADYIAQAILEFEKHENERENESAFRKSISTTIKETIHEVLGQVTHNGYKLSFENIEDAKEDCSLNNSNHSDEMGNVPKVKSDELFGKEDYFSSDRKPIGLDFEGELQKSLKIFTG